MGAVVRGLVMGWMLVAVLGRCLAGDAWTEDFEAAKAQAAKESKDLLVDFTGSDWCGWCKKLDAEVFGLEAFHKEAGKSFVLVKLDFPRNTPQSDERRKQNEALRDKHQVRGFPTVLLMDAAGNAYAKTGYQEGGQEEYCKHLETLRAGKAEWQKLRAAVDTAEGIEKAKSLDALIEYQGSRDLPVDAQQVKAICELDADGKAGLKEKYEARMILQDLGEKVEAAVQAGNLEEVFTLMDSAVKNEKVPAEKKQQILVGKANLQMRLGKRAETLATLKQAQELAPESELGKRIPGFIKQVEAAPAEDGGKGKGAQPEE